MSKKRGLSLEEKRKRMLEIFYEKKEFFHLKELEKIAPKQKGITPMSVKDVVQSLVDDDMVMCEKVGSSSYYWAFPSQAINIRMNKLASLKAKLSETEKKLVTINKNIEEAKSDRKETDQRKNVLNELKDLRRKQEEALEKLKSLKENDPAVLDEIQSEISSTKDSANKWTDNLFVLKSWIKRKFPIEESQIDKQFEIPEDLDYIE